MKNLFRKLLRLFGRFYFQCPDCGTLYRRYFDGHDCPCGKIHLCGSCVEKHRAHVVVPEVLDHLSQIDKASDVYVTLPNGERRNAGVKLWKGKRERRKVLKSRRGRHQPSDEGLKKFLSRATYE